MSDSYFLGVDAGGTKTHCMITDQDNNIISEWKTGSGNYVAVGLEKALENILEGILVTRLKAQNKLNANTIHIQYTCLGIASLDTHKDHELLEKEIIKLCKKINIAHPIIINDALIALRTATTSENEIVIICGTGTNCYGKNSVGKETWVDGLEPLLGDSASGYTIGREVLRYAIRSSDHRIKKTAIEELVLTHFGISTARDLKNIVYKPDFTKAKVSELSKIVFDAYAQNDWASTEILDKVATEAIHIIQTAAKNLDVSEYDLVLAGGLFSNKPFLERVIEHFSTLNGNVKIKILDKPPVWGAIEIAKEKYFSN
jgi:N-acetylglucosamine kinase-like BadF-type ATPase